MPSQPTLSMELLTRSSEVQPGDLVLRRIEGAQELSRLYEYRVELMAPGDTGLSPEAQQDMLRMPCMVLYGPDGQLPLHGVLRSFRMKSTASGRDVHYEAILVPRVWMLTQVQRSRVFQELDVPGILRAVLTELGLVEDQDFELRLASTYPVSEYTVQYQETDFDFISRLLEHHGIFYYFRQLPDQEVLTFGDSNAAFDHYGEDPIPYAFREAHDVGQQGIHHIDHVFERRPAGVILRDYNWRTPRVQLQSEAAADGVVGVGFHNYYGEHFKDPGEGAQIARVRAEALLADRDLYEMRSTLWAVGCGHRFEVTGHPFGEVDQEYVVTRVEQVLDAGDDAAQIQRLTAIPFTVPYRPQRTTPRPRIEGIMHGFVDGEVPGTAAPIDTHGRYKVWLPFDLVGVPGGKASRWIRMSQPSSGPGYGMHFPLHIGVEVAIAHVDGDPDRPIIMSSPPNAETVTPVRDENATQSKIRTKTGIRITFDDDVV